MQPTPSRRTNGLNTAEGNTKMLSLKHHDNTQFVQQQELTTRPQAREERWPPTPHIGKPKALILCQDPEEWKK
jgi:hypothetical protein